MTGPVFLKNTIQGFLSSWRFSLFGGELGTFMGEHSVEDHYLHINGIISILPVPTTSLVMIISV